MVVVADAPAQRSREKLYFDVPFTKAAPASATVQDGSGDLVLSGYASTWTLDRDNEIVAPDAFKGSLADYLTQNPVVLWQHEMKNPIGKVTAAHTDETGLYVTVVIPNPGPDAADWQKGAYSSIKLGNVRTFSVGGYFTRDVEMGPGGPVFSIVEAELFEISCVSIPANASSIFEAMMKSLYDEPQDLNERARGQLKQLIGFEALADPELLLMAEESRSKRYDLLAGMFAKANSGHLPPAMGLWTRLEQAEEKGADPVQLVDMRIKTIRAFWEPVSPEQKAGRKISAATKSKLEDALAKHDVAHDHIIDAAESLKNVAEAHDAAASTLRDVLGMTEEEQEDGTQDGDDHADEKPSVKPKPKPTTAASKAVPDGKKQCPTCKGSGKIQANTTKCPTCKGSGNVDEDYTPPAEKSAQGEQERILTKQLSSMISQQLSAAGQDRFEKDETASDEDYCYCYLDDFDVDQNWAVFCTFGPGASDRYVKVGYTRGPDGQVTLGTDVTPVEPARGYIPKAAAYTDEKGVQRFPSPDVRTLHMTSLSEVPS